MADKGKGDESYEFLPPDFDEDQFIHREMVSFKTTVILFAWGILAAALSWGLFAALDGRQSGWLVGLLVCAAFFAALRPLFARFKADIKHWGRREWIGTAFLFFFTWLGVFIVAINPPVSDYAPPRVDLHVGPPVQQAGGRVAVDVFYEDNDDVASHTFRIAQGGLAIAGDEALTDLGRGHYRYEAVLPAGIYEVTASAADGKGNADGANATLRVVDVALNTYLPDGNALDAPTDQVLVQVAAQGLDACAVRKGRITHVPCIRTVHLDRPEGGRVVLEHSNAEGGWKATSNFAGWAPGQNTFNVTAEVIGAYEGNTFVDGGDITAGPHTLNVTAPIGTYVPKVINDPAAHQRSVPALGPIALAAALLALAATLRRR